MRARVKGGRGGQDNAALGQTGNHGAVDEGLRLSPLSMRPSLTGSGSGSGSLSHTHTTHKTKIRQPIWNSCLLMVKSRSDLWAWR